MATAWFVNLKSSQQELISRLIEAQTTQGNMEALNAVEESRISKRASVLSAHSEERDENVLSVTVILQDEALISKNENGELSREISIHQERTVKDLAIEVNNWLQKPGTLPASMSFTSFKIWYKNQVINMSDTLTETGVKTGARLFVRVDRDGEEAEEKGRSRSINSEAESSRSTNRIKLSEYGKLEHLKPPQPGYTTSPTIEQLATMTREQLSSVKDFVIMNEHGNISFQDRVDLTEVDLGKDVVIEHQVVDVYPEEIANSTEKPPVGQKLNVPAVIQLHNIKPKKGQSI